MKETVLVLDFGGYVKEMVAAAVRNAKVYAEVRAGNLTATDVAALKPIGIILTGGKARSKIDDGIFDIGIPVIGIGCGGGVVSHKADYYTLSDFNRRGKDIVGSFLSRIGASYGYELSHYVEEQCEAIRQQTKGEKVLLALSGGVDSSVCAEMLSRAIPNKLVCIFVDTGLMRYNEGDEIEAIFSKKNLHFIRVNAEERFLSRLKGVTDPEQKRKIIGEEFVNVFTEEAQKLGTDVTYLAQGTIYPDIIESYGDTFVKSHHNVGGLPEKLSFKGLVEPLKFLFKSEVRAIGRQLGLPDYLVERQPFPGPGLSVRVLGEVTKDKLDTLRLADKIVREELIKIKRPPTQYFAVLTGLKAVGVKKGKRIYDNVIAVRAVETANFMTAKVTRVPYGVLERIAKRIVTEVKAARVLFDITSKPPATIEYE